MILIDEEHVWEISDALIHKLVPLHNIDPKGKLTVKQKCVLNQILDKFRRKPEVPALLKLKKGH